LKKVKGGKALHVPNRQDPAGNVRYFAGDGAEWVAGFAGMSNTFVYHQAIYNKN